MLPKTKQNILATLVATNECFNNKVSYGTPQKDVLQRVLLESVREDFIVKGATAPELVAFDEALKAVNERLQLYREGNGPEEKGDV